MKDSELTLRALVQRAAERYPDRVAVADDILSFSYAELLLKIRQMATLLHSRGVRKGDRVALMMPASVSHVVALFGAIELGAIPVGLHVRESETILTDILVRISPRVLVYDGAFAEKAHNLLQAVPLLMTSIRSQSSITAVENLNEDDTPVIPRDLGLMTQNIDPMPVSPDETAVIALSSGTTGVPKGIIHTHRTLLASARNGALYAQATENSTTINIFTTAFIGWYNCTLPFLYAGSRMIFISKWKPAQFLQTIEDEKVTVFFLVPTMWRMLLNEKVDSYDLSSLQRVGYGGEAMDSATMARIREQFCSDVVNTYGTTETGSWGGCTVMLPEDYTAGRDIESVGRPAQDVDIRIIRPGSNVDQILPPGQSGEVIIRGPSVASSVWDQPDIAAKIFDHGWWRSGDQGFIDEDGYLYLQGRIDDMIISGGINVLPGQIEETILTHPAVSECVVLGLPHDKWGQQITALVLAREKISAEELAEHVNRSALSDYKKPREYHFIDEFPRGNTGKVNRRLLRQQLVG